MGFLNDQLKIIKDNTRGVNTDIRKIINKTERVMEKINNKEDISFDEISEINKIAYELQEKSKDIDDRTKDNFNYIILK